jgi:hypothetical protein
LAKAPGGGLRGESEEGASGRAREPAARSQESIAAGSPEPQRGEGFPGALASGRELASQIWMRRRRCVPGVLHERAIQQLASPALVAGSDGERR